MCKRQKKNKTAPSAV